jgi:protein TonB
MKTLTTILTFALAAICTTGYAQSDSASQTDESVIVSDMSEFPGCDSVLHIYITDSTKYPEEAKSKGLEVRVMVNLVVSKTGNIETVKVSRGINPDLDKEAVRAVQNLPEQCIPKCVRPMRMSYTVPVYFSFGKAK